MDRKANPRGWLFGPAPDLLWGAGLGYAAVFALLVFASAPMMSAFPPWFMMFFVVLLSMPHYGATILRVYERGEDRRAYAFFAKYATLLVGLLFLWGVRDPWVGSLLFTLYLTWSPWHYTGQNYGITLMFLSRRGADVDPRTKLLLRVSYVASYFVTLFFIHGPYTAFPFAGDRVQFLSLNVPALAADVALFVGLLVYGASSALVAAALLPRGVRRVAPALALMSTQALWFVVPAAVKNWLPYAGVPILTSSHDAYAFTWIALGHAMQYLWVTAFFARASGRAASTGAFYFKALMAGCALWAVPLLVFAPGLLGKLPYDIGLASVTAAAVNLHHFVLDGAIWKLRDSRIGRILLRRPSMDSPSGGPRKAFGTGWPLVATGVASIAVLLFAVVVEEFGLARALTRKDFARAEVAIERLATVGRDSHRIRMEVGALATRQGELARAVHHLQAGVRLYPTPYGWARLGEALSAHGEPQAAIEAFENALALDPADETAKMRLALTWAEIGETAKAREILDGSGSGKETLWSRKLRQQLIELLES